MMNHIWFGLIASAVVVAAFSGRMEAVTAASIDSAKSAVTLALGLVGVMAFWLGMTRILEEAGLLRSLARGLRPVMTRLFPEVPADHPAMSAMIMNMASNMLGLGNAATPFGIKAMMELDKLNEHRGTATNAMALFLAINTSNVALAPLGVISLRASLGSADAAGIWIPTFLATAFSTTVAILAAKSLQRFFPAGAAVGAAVDTAVDTAVDAAVGTAAGPDGRVATAQPDLPEIDLDNGRQPAEPSTAGRVAAWSVALAILVAFVYGLATSTATGEYLRSVTQHWLLPVLIALIVSFGITRRVDVYDAAVAGAKEGFQVALRIIPFLVMILVAVGMFRASGALDMIINGIRPLTEFLGFPAEALPMALLRPLSGSGAYGIMAETMQSHGPDSFVGYLVSTLQGSTETTFYVVAVYFGAVGVTRLRHALAAGLIADAAGIVGATVAVTLFLSQ